MNGGRAAHAHTVLISEDPLFSLLAPHLPPEALCALACTSRPLHDSVYAAEHVWEALAVSWTSSPREPLREVISGMRTWRETVCALWRERRACRLAAQASAAGRECDRRAEDVAGLQARVRDGGSHARMLEARAAPLGALLARTSSTRERVAQWHLAAMRRAPSALSPPSRADAERVGRELAELRVRIAEARTSYEGAKERLREASSAWVAARRRHAALEAALLSLSRRLAAETAGDSLRRMGRHLLHDASVFGPGPAAAFALAFFKERVAEWNAARAEGEAPLRVEWPPELDNALRGAVGPQGAAPGVGARCSSPLPTGGCSTSADATS